MADYKIGIEEEYFLVDAATKSVTRAMPEGFLDAAKKATGGQIMGEFLQSQVEAVTLPHTDIKTAREELRHLRQAVARVAAEHGLAILAAGTHPTADWGRSQQTEGDRYDAVMDDLQMVGQRNMLCGLHVHVELPDPDERVDVMTRMLPYLPLFIALATSSPFWRSRPTGLKGYRLAAYDELPRTGVPELFHTKEEFDAYVDALVNAGVMQDSSYIWWSMRPSLKHPTLELRAPDVPTLVDDFDRHRRAVAFAGAPPHPQSVAQRQPQRRVTRHRGREQVARAALWRAWLVRRQRRLGNGGRNDRAGAGGDRGGRRRTRLPLRDAPLPHHRRRRHLRGRADRGVRNARQEGRPRRRAAGGQGLAGSRDAAIALSAYPSPFRGR